MTHTSSTVSTTPVLPRQRREERVNRDDLQKMLDECADHVAILLRGPRDPKSHKHVGMNAVQLVDRVATATSAPDGRTNHSPGTEPPDSPPRNVLDKDGNVIPPDPDPGYEVSDPTGRAALALLGGAVDQERVALTRLARDVVDALDLLRDAVRALNRSQPPDTPHGTGERACTSHARLKRFEPVDAKYPGTELCRWCYDWRAIHGKVPPLPILEMRVSGKRITPAVMKKYKLSA